MNVDELDVLGLRLLRSRVGDAMHEKIDARIAELEAATPPAPRDEPNQWEREYGAILRSDPAVARAEFNSVRLRLAAGAWYKPDWWVLYHDGHEEMHEVKGHWRDRDRVRVKVAARLYGWRWTFRAVRKRKLKDGGGWSVETFAGE